MNPPSALAGAMSRDRKPFTYTPGGIDLSEIKSEKMAKRLMRNAMNQGVPERPQQLQSPPTPTTPIAVPNYNCLPVQVFPTFNLPANPKSLLRTRSAPGQPQEPTLERGPPPQFVNNVKPMAAPELDIFNKNTPTYSQINNNRPASIYEPSSNGTRPMNYGSSGHTAAIPESSYDVPEYMRVQPNAATINTYTPINPTVRSEYSYNNNQIMPEVKDTVPTLDVVSPSTVFYNNDNKINKEAENNVSTTTKTVSKPVQEEHASTEQSEVKITKKQVKQETSVKETNGTQNGDENGDAEMTVKLPTKKSAAKTETQVEVSKKTLPDGTVEEVKKTITTTTIDGKTEIRTKTETRLIPKDDGEDEEEEYVEEEEEEEGEVQEVEEQETKKPDTTVVIKNKENGSIIKTAESSETKTTSTKKVVTIQDDKKEEADEELEEEDVEEEVEAEPVTFVIKKAAERPPTPKENNKDEEPEEEQPVEIVEAKETKVEEIVLNSSKNVEEDVDEEIEQQIETKEEKLENKDEEEVEEEEEYEEAEETEDKEEVKVIKEDIKSAPETKNEDESGNDAGEENKEENVQKETENEVKETEERNNSKTEMQEQQIDEEKQEVIVESQEVKSEKPEVVKEVILTPKIESSETKPSLREPSVPLEKVEDLEIKPIGAGDFTKTHTQTTEIIANPDLPSIVTKYNRTETIETVKRSVETLDPTPPISFFTPHVEKVLPSQIQRPYQPVYAPEPAVERRHSLLLERLSMERQLPTDVYQNSSSYSNQTTEQQQWSQQQEPQAEILEVANVKPSTITNQQWFQQSKKDVYYNDSTPVVQSTPPIWVQQQSQPQQQPIYSPQPSYQPSSPQPQSQPKLSPQPQFQRQPSPQPQYQQPSPQPQYQQTSPQPQYQQTSPQPQYQQSTQPQFQPTYSNSTQQNTSSTQYTSYPSKPSTWTPGTNSYETSSQSNQYSSYQNKQQFSSSYVPPPWEQDKTYVTETSQNYYQPPPQTPFSPTPAQSWKPPPGKFTKPVPTAYIPPKPNQSFVKPVTNVEPPRMPGRKTYYSEYERRYISVPESTYIPGETKFQAQPDPSPQYYYDNNEPTEQVEHEWRKELREFTEKTQTSTQTSVNPPWESEKIFPKTPEAYTPTPTWSQTVRPQSWRERSFESEFVSQEWPKTNTLGRGRPLSSYGKETIPERTRGVSVDRYNPNNYQSPVPAEHPPVQTFTHNPPAPHATGYHNPNVPAYHARASAEPREQQTYQQPRAWRAPQPTPIQSRSFKYLQWITGTDD